MDNQALDGVDGHTINKGIVNIWSVKPGLPFQGYSSA